MSEIREILKLVSDNIQKKTVNELLDKDITYLEIKNEQEKAYKNYVNLHMPDEQREIIDILLEKKNELDYEYQANVYMAGMLDGYKILKQFGMTKE